MKLIVTSIFASVLFTVAAQSQESISIGTVMSVKSAVLNETRKIWIYEPSSDHSGERDRYPVLYLLDAEEHFHSTVGMVKQMSGRWPAMIVVGIPNTQRDRDLKPLIRTKNGIEDTTQPFLDFIAHELAPQIDSIYPTAPYRILSGHSLGGLTVVNALVNYTEKFQAYVAIDPSLWWHDQRLVVDAREKLTSKKFDNTSLFIGRARNMPPTIDTLSALKDKSEYTMLFRAVTQFRDDLQKSGKGLRWTSKFYPEETHGTVQLNAQYDALKFLFSYYAFRTSAFQINPSMNIDSALVAHFKNVSRHLGYAVRPSKGLVNNLGYTCMGMKKWDKAETFFNMNITNYPADANGYDSLGDFYQARGNKLLAIENYAKALTLGSDPDTRRKLDLLRGTK